jgi:hypothetical protein
VRWQLNPNELSSESDLNPERPTVDRSDDCRHQGDQRNSTSSPVVHPDLVGSGGETPPKPDSLTGPGMAIVAGHDDVAETNASQDNVYWSLAERGENQQDDPASLNPAPEVPPPSWIFRFGSFLKWISSRAFGVVSLVFLLAVAANIPLLQFLSFGYLLEVMGRLARQQRLASALIGLKKASHLGGIILGTWLMLLPIRLVSNFWFEANLIAPTSQQTQVLRFIQIVLTVLIVAHIGAAWLCGGKLRYFFWPVVAPFSFGMWIARRLAGWRYARRTLELSTGWFAPRLANDIVKAPPIRDWFLPAIFFRRLVAGNLFVTARNGVWNFVEGLNLPYYFWLGLKGFIGTFLWLLIPTSLIVVSTFTEDGAAILSGLFGVLFAIPVFALLPFIQAHFAKDGQMVRFLEVSKVMRNFGQAPLAHLTALLAALILALPLFFLKIEEIPRELLWTLSIAFILFIWPAKILIGLAYRRGDRRAKSSRWWIRYPVASLTIPISFSYVIIMMFTRYISWNGAFSLFENHVFLLPAPFWQ